MVEFLSRRTSRLALHYFQRGRLSFRVCYFMLYPIYRIISKAIAVRCARESHQLRPKNGSESFKTKSFLPVSFPRFSRVFRPAGETFELWLNVRLFLRFASRLQL